MINKESKIQRLWKNEINRYAILFALILAILMAFSHYIYKFSIDSSFFTNYLLVYVSFVSILIASKTYDKSEEEIDTTLRRYKIDDIEKRLEKVYNPIYEILRTAEIVDGNEDSREIEIVEFDNICSIFKSYSYLITNKEIIVEWENANENRPKSSIMYSRKYYYCFVGVDFIKLIDKERDKLISEHKKLVK